jgi:hypothetical protein
MPRPYDPAGEERYPDLFQLLTLGAYSDGCERILPTLRVYREPGVYCVALQDHEMGRQVRAAATTLDGLWEALERVLADPLAWTTFRSQINRSGEPFSLRKKASGQPKP